MEIMKSSLNGYTMVCFPWPHQVRNYCPGTCHVVHSNPRIISVWLRHLLDWGLSRPRPPRIQLFLGQDGRNVKPVIIRNKLYLSFPTLYWPTYLKWLTTSMYFYVFLHFILQFAMQASCASRQWLPRNGGHVQTMGLVHWGAPRVQRWKS